MNVVAQVREPSLRDNEVLDEFTIPFGAWMEQVLDWFRTDDGTRVDWLERPSRWFVNDVVEGFLIELSWTTVAVAILAVGWALRNWKIGVASAAGLVSTGLLAELLWLHTMWTVGMLIGAVVAALTIGALVGAVATALDVADQVRRIVRGLELVFIWPLVIVVILLFGVGPSTAVMLSALLAVFPVVRIVMLRAELGPGDDLLSWLDSMRVAANQAAMVAMMSLATLAIMGAGGLGTSAYGGLLNLDVAGATRAGVAIAVVTVVVDRLTRPNGIETPLLGSLTQALANRNATHLLLRRVPLPAARRSPTCTVSRPAAVGLVVGAAIAVASLWIAWNEAGGGVTAIIDVAPVSSSDALDASGGSYFGVAVLLVSLALGAAGIVSLSAPHRRAWWMTGGYALSGAVAMMVVLTGYLVVATGEGTRIGAGPWVALIGGTISCIAALGSWHAASRQRLLLARPGRLVGGAAAVALMAVGSNAVWLEDRSTEFVFDERVQAEIDRLTELGRTDPSQAAVAAAQISALVAQVRPGELVTYDGLTDGDIGLGRVLVAAAAVALALTAAEVVSPRLRERTPIPSIALGLALGCAVASTAWIVSIQRVVTTDGPYGPAPQVTGFGAMLTVVAGLMLTISTRHPDQPEQQRTYTVR